MFNKKSKVFDEFDGISRVLLGIIINNIALLVEKDNN